MAYYDSPQDLFASEDSDSDATVDLSVPSATEPRHPAAKDKQMIASDSGSMLVSEKQKEKRRSPLQRRTKHTISSSDSEDDGPRSGCASSMVNKCSLGLGSIDTAAATGVAKTLNSGNNIVTNVDKRVECSQQHVTAPLDDYRPLCKYGELCYRRNPSHFEEFRHPGGV